MESIFSVSFFCSIASTFRFLVFRRANTASLLCLRLSPVRHPIDNIKKQNQNKKTNLKEKSVAFVWNRRSELQLLKIPRNFFPIFFLLILIILWKLIWLTEISSFSIFTQQAHTQLVLHVFEIFTENCIINGCVTIHYIDSSMRIEAFEIDKSPLFQ